jgi:hypothetical protein
MPSGSGFDQAAWQEWWEAYTACIRNCALQAEICFGNCRGLFPVPPLANSIPGAACMKRCGDAHEACVKACDLIKAKQPVLPLKPFTEEEKNRAAKCSYVFEGCAAVCGVCALLLTGGAAAFLVASGGTLFYAGLASVFGYISTDPVDPNYKKVPEIKPKDLLKLMKYRGKVSGALKRWLDLVATSMALGDALYLCINRAQGAAAEQDAAVEGKQLKAARAYARRLADLLDKEEEALQAAIKAERLESSLRDVKVSKSDAAQLANQVLLQGWPEPVRGLLSSCMPDIPHDVVWVRPDITPFFRGKASSTTAFQVTRNPTIRASERAMAKLLRSFAARNQR